MNNEVEKFITDFQEHAMIHGSQHFVTGLHMPRGWHSETILKECVDKFGEHVYKDAKDFLIKQTERK
jgi:hypothetical protein|tara:strand:+ start:663 stop:863 length:201 start_codon:yes stop_codon:yes gene_type:complete